MKCFFFNKRFWFAARDMAIERLNILERLIDKGVSSKEATEKTKALEGLVENAFNLIQSSKAASFPILLVLEMWIIVS